MDLSTLPNDFFVTLGQYTKTVYRDQYPAIDPTSPALSQKGKVVIVTGASRGLGQKAFAAAFAKAGAKGLVLVARKVEGLEETEKLVKGINPDVEVLTQALDVRDAEAIKSLFAKVKEVFGTADVLINNAGAGTSAMPLGAIDTADFWYDFEINVKGTLFMSQNFLKLVGPEKSATIINISSQAGIMVMPTTSSYSLSKLVQIQIQRFISAENPNVVAVSMQPGSVKTAITKPAFEKFSLDTHELAGGTAVWLATDQAKFMNGRFTNANWSVADLMEMKDHIISKGDLLMELQKTPEAS